MKKIISKIIIGAFINGQVNGFEKIYELKYIVNDCRWELYKM